MLMRFDPFRELDRQFDRLSQRNWGAGVMPIDAYRRGDHFYVHFDLPGVDADSVDLEVEKNVLTVKAERSWEPAEGDEVVVAERPRGTFTRQLFLGETLDTEHIEANYDKGVLTVSIPVAEAAKPRKVAIGAADNGTADENSRVEAINANSSAA